MRTECNLEIADLFILFVSNSFQNILLKAITCTNVNMSWILKRQEVQGCV